MPAFGLGASRSTMSSTILDINALDSLLRNRLCGSSNLQTATMSLCITSKHLSSVLPGKLTLEARPFQYFNLPTAIDLSILTPGLTLCAIVDTIEASFATCSLSRSNVSLIRSDSVFSYPSLTETVKCGTSSCTILLKGPTHSF